MQNLQIYKIQIQGLSSTFSVFKHFQGPWIFHSNFKHFQGFLKHAMNHDKIIKRTLNKYTEMSTLTSERVKWITDRDQKTIYNRK